MVGDRASGRVPDTWKTALLLGDLRQHNAGLPADLASRQHLGPARARLQQESFPSNTQWDSNGERRRGVDASTFSISFAFLYIA